MFVWPRATATATVALSIFLTGCATMQSHDETANRVQSASRGGDFKAALAQLDERNASADAKKELLYNLEKGELLRMDRQYGPSTEAFLVADAKVREWEDAAKTDPQKLLGTLGAAVISERLKTYEGQDYEKVWLTTRLALNRVAQNDLENARVDIKRTHEREAVIAEFRAKETAAAEEEAKSKGATVSGKELNGYPVETLNDPEVLALKNGYQNALSHYLAGFMYEVLNESGLAAPGYRKAIELRPGLGVLEEGLRGLDDRSSFTWKRRQQMTDTLFLVEAGVAPARKPKAFQLPVPTGRGVVLTSISYPVIEPSKDPLLTTLQVAGYSLKLDNVVDVNVMARRALKDEMPGMVLRGVSRAIVKGVMQNELQKRGGLLGGLVGAVASAATEQADDRMWRMLPGRVYVARGYLPPGVHRVTLNGREVGEVKVDGQYALVPLRLHEDALLVGDIANLGQLVPAPVAEPAPVAAPVPELAVVKSSTSNTQKSNTRTTPAKPASKPAASSTAKPVASTKTSAAQKAVESSK